MLLKKKRLVRGCLNGQLETYQLVKYSDEHFMRFYVSRVSDFSSLNGYNCIQKLNGGPYLNQLAFANLHTSQKKMTVMN